MSTELRQPGRDGQCGSRSSGTGSSPTRARQGPDGKPVYTVGSDDYIPVLVLPTDKKIRFVEHSEDVIHSFWVPEMLFKRDVFPGNVVNQFETTIVTEGAVRGPLRRALWHLPLDDELRGEGGVAGEVPAVHAR